MEYTQTAPSKTSKNGRPKSDERTTINTIIFVLITGCRWIDLPCTVWSAYDDSKLY